MNHYMVLSQIMLLAGSSILTLSVLWLQKDVGFIRGRQSENYFELCELKMKVSDLTSKLERDNAGLIEFIVTQLCKLQLDDMKKKEEEDKKEEVSL